MACLAASSALLLLGTSCGSSRNARSAGAGEPTSAPRVPPPIERRGAGTTRVLLNATVNDITLAPGVRYHAWAFNDLVPAPFIRAREGDTLEVIATSTDPTGMPHNLDFHSVTGPGGGAPLTTVTPGERAVGVFKLLHPGLFIYHCGAPPVMDHIANGMYGLMLVEPEGGMKPVDREYYVLQSEFYTTAPADGSDFVAYSREDGLREDPRFILFNGHGGALMGEGALRAATGETVRIFFGNAGPNKMSSFHVIGEVFDRVYRDGDLVSPPARHLQTVMVPPGSATVVEFRVDVPGTYMLVDHAIFRTAKGATGLLKVTGAERPDLYRSGE